jgi:signal transduction histidine kinase
MLRYRLWDVDLVINRALVYGALAVAMGIVYAAVIGAFAATMSSVSGLWPSLVAAGVVVAIVQPIRTWLQQRVNRFLYGFREEPYAALSRLGRRLQETPTPDDALPAIVEAVAQALRSPGVSIELERDGEYAPTASVGAVAGGDPVIFPLVHQGENVGRLVLNPRAPGERFDERDMRLLADLAGQASAVVHAVRLSAELRRSRELTVAAREEERRRLRRDLHDGLGPALAAVVLELDAARAAVAIDPAAADALLLRLRGQAQEAIAEIRRLVDGLRPPALDELGLAGSIRQHADALGAVVDAPESLPPLPAAVEVAAYRIALEGMTNAARHAPGCGCVVRLRVDDGLEVEVSDDGTGLERDASPGVGLASMRDRAAELGGTLDIESTGLGTRMLARLPLPA